MLRGNREPEYRRRIREKAEKYQQSAKAKERESTEKCNRRKTASAIERIEQELRRTNDENTPQKKRDRYWERFGFLGLWFAGLVGVAAILVGTYDAEKQRGVMHDQLTAMDGQLQEMRNEQRPWVSMDVHPVGEGLRHNERGWYLMTAVALTNIGKTPANLVFVSASINPYVEPVWTYNNGIKQVVSGTDVARTVDAICAFAEAFNAMGSAAGNVLFPNEIIREKRVAADNIPLAGIVDAHNDRYFGHFLLTICVLYGPATSRELPYRTAKAFIVDKRLGGISLDGENIPPDQLFLIPAIENGSSIK